MEKIEKIFNTKILCAFKCGAHAYGMLTDFSDTDIVVIVDDDNTFRHVGKNESADGRTEYFVFGKTYFKALHEVHEDTHDFCLVHSDCILALKENPELILQLEDSYKAEFDEILNRDWKLTLASFLERFTIYFRMMLIPELTAKRYYHIYRMRAMLDNLDKNGEFNLNYAEPYKTLMLDYKKNFLEKTNLFEVFLDEIKYIEDYVVKLRGE